MIPATAFAPACAATEAASRAIRLMDLTSLNDDDHDARIIALCHQAQTPVGNTAAVCIYPRFVGLARLTLAAQGWSTSPTVTMSWPACWPRPVQPFSMAPTKSIW
ncbi:hypothetical protein KAM461_06280 [Aeromonas hydrophila]|nr:hypothetical protein KAM461_06280 [Aeromonas hydrophila]